MPHKTWTFKKDLTGLDRMVKVDRAMLQIADLMIENHTVKLNSLWNKDGDMYLTAVWLEKEVKCPHT